MDLAVDQKQKEKNCFNNPMWIVSSPDFIAPWWPYSSVPSARWEKLGNIMSLCDSIRVFRNHLEFLRFVGSRWKSVKVCGIE